MRQNGVRNGNMIRKWHTCRQNANGGMSTAREDRDTQIRTKTISICKGGAM